MWVNPRSLIVKTRTPYHEGFIADAKKIGGVWSYDERLWHFSLEKEAQVEALMLKHFKYRP